MFRNRKFAIAYESFLEKESVKTALAILNGDKETLNDLKEIDPTKSKKYVEVFAKILVNSDDGDETLELLEELREDIIKIEQKQKPIENLQKIKTIENLKEAIDKSLRTASKSELKRGEFGALQKGKDYVDLSDFHVFKNNGLKALAPLNVMASKIISSENVGGIEGDWCIRFPNSWKKYIGGSPPSGFIIAFSKTDKFAIQLTRDVDNEFTGPIVAIWNENNQALRPSSKMTALFSTFGIPEEFKDKNNPLLKELHREFWLRVKGKIKA